MVPQILWLLFALTWGTENLFLTRGSYGSNVEEDTWSFGQFFPMILLILPVLNIVETYYGE